MAEHIRTGLRGEDIAAEYLVAQGWLILARRWRDPSGGRGSADVDIIARSADGKCHFVEVKTRTGSGSLVGTDFAPEAAVTPAKARRMVCAAERYMALEGLSGEIAVDLITVVLPTGAGAEPVLRYLRDIVR